MSKQTAVDWLIEEINQMQKIYIDLNKKDKSLKKGVDAILTATTLLKMKCITAKEMEKEQIKEAYMSALPYGLEYSHYDKYANKYYNEIYKKEDK
jgi:hypothetical protein